MSHSWTLLIALHAAGATLAVALGGFQLLRRRRGDLLHRRIGRLWMADMYWVAFSSFGIRQLDPGHFTWIHALSAWTIVSLSLAVWTARRGNIRAHRAWATGSYLGLLGAGIAAVAIPSRLVPQTAMHAPWALLGGLLAVTALAAGCIALAATLHQGQLGLVRLIRSDRNQPPVGRLLQ
jgi:uncharacterized membrane protein